MKYFALIILFIAITLTVAAMATNDDTLCGLSLISIIATFTAIVVVAAKARKSK